MRYIGNKTKLLNEIEKMLKSKGVYTKDSILCDLFAGTCSVGDYFKNDLEIIANDTMYCAYVIANAKLKYASYFFKKLGFDPFEYFNNIDTENYTKGFCYNTFAPTVTGRQYFSDENAKMIDYIRDTIDEWFVEGYIDENEKYYLIASLLESVSKVSNVAGVYCAYLKIWDPRAIKRMTFIPVELNGESPYKNEVYNENAFDLIKKIKGDILYLDPPYTSSQYSSQYHVLETIAKNDRPEVTGIGGHRDKTNQSSNFCKKGKVEKEFEQIIASANFKYILLSYSDAGLMSKDFIEKVLKRYAKEGTYTFKKISYKKYKNTRAVKKEYLENTKNKEHFEWLFFIEKKEKPSYVSPLNYIGGKGHMIDFLKGHFPKNIDTFYDLFGGGATVSINASANKVVYNDINWIVRDLLEKITHDDIYLTIRYIEKTIKKYGLEKGNKETYVDFRKKYNSISEGSRNPLDLYLLICYGFEHQIRFNSKYEFNNPCGNSGFSQEMLEKLISYSRKTKEMNIVFKSKDYLSFEKHINNTDFVYCDPPYLLTCGAYNDGKRGFNGWDKEQEQRLLDFLLRLHKKGVKFMLSNILERNELKNDILLKWIKDNNFTVVEDANLVSRNRQNRKEVIIKNY